MSHRKTLSSLAVAALLVATSAVPVASAMPIDPRQRDMHASTVQKQAQKQDLRSEAAVERSETPVRPQTHTPVAKQDMRSEAAADPKPASPPVGLPTWPVDPEPIVPVSDEPVATVGGDGIEWPLSGVLIAAALLLGGTLGIVATRYRVGHSHAA